MLPELSWRNFTASFGSKLDRLKKMQREKLETATALARTLLSTKGELGGIRFANMVANLYDQMDDHAAEAFFASLVNDFDASVSQVTAAAHAYLEHPTPDNACLLSAAVEAPRQELIRRLNMASGGTNRILRMRERVLAMDKTHPEFAPLAADLRHLLASWFNRGFLEMRLIDWRTPAAVLEKIIKYEAVHEIRDWDDLRRRVHGDRRCFGFFHPALPEEPLIFVEVALTNAVSNAIEPLLNQTSPPVGKYPKTAIFYSISNCQPGLRNISFGNFLIKQVVADLQAEMPSLKTFATLSPIPGFRRWLEKAMETDPALAGVRAQLADPRWADDTAKTDRLREPLLTFCARYLNSLKPDGTPGGAVDPVARFHLSNGARLERINWRANLSPRGMAESFGLMVNYRYIPNTIEANHEAFVSRGAIVHSRSISSLLAAGRSSEAKLHQKLPAIAPASRHRTSA